MKRTVLLLLIMVFLFAITFVGCQQIKESDHELILGYSMPSMGNPFWISVTDAMRQEASNLNVRLIIRDAENDIARQAADIEDLIEQNVDVLLVTPYDSVSLAPTIKKANEAGIPVIIVDIGINDPSVEYESFIITDNYKGGQLAGEWLVNYIEENGIKDPIVATIQAQLGAENAMERHNGFIDVMEKNGIEVVLNRPANSLRDEAIVIMEDYLQSYPDLTAVFAENDDMALGALQAVKQAKANTVIIGYDGILSACKEIAADTNLKADVDQRPYEIGAKAIGIAMQLINGEKVKKKTIITPVLITQENVDVFIDKYR